MFIIGEIVSENYNESQRKLAAETKGQFGEIFG